MWEVENNETADIIVNHFARPTVAEPAKAASLCFEHLSSHHQVALTLEPSTASTHERHPRNEATYRQSLHVAHQHLICVYAR